MEMMHAVLHVIHRHKAGHQERDKKLSPPGESSFLDSLAAQRNTIRYNLTTVGDKRGSIESMDLFPTALNH